MRMVLKPLAHGEFRLVLEILNTATDDRAGTGPLAALEKKCVEFASKSIRHKVSGSVWRQPDDIPARALKRQWQDARRIWEEVIVGEDRRSLKGFFLHLPAIGLPMKIPVPLLHDPNDLANWLLARAIANRQHLRVVKCARCHKFGVRRRGRAQSRYCSAACQQQATIEKAKAHKPRRSSEPERLGRLFRRS